MSALSSAESFEKRATLFKNFTGIDMALKKCEECSKEISTDASECPNCGAKQAKKTSALSWIVALFFGAVLFNMISRSGNTVTSSNQAPLSNDVTRREATGACMEFVKKILHDPDSAKFPHSDEAAVFLKENRAFVIRSVRSKNAFGTVRLSEFACFLEKNNGQIYATLVAEKGNKSAEVQKLREDWGL